MTSAWSLQRGTQVFRGQTGIVIPVYFPQDIDISCGTDLLHDTVSAYCEHVTAPSTICLSVDGEAFGGDVALSITEKFGTQICIAPVNQGKLRSAALGVQRLLDNPHLTHFAIVDQDGDHFPNKLLNLIRAALHISSEALTDRTLVLGQRLSRHHPMCFFRGELEELADRTMLDALAYHAVQSGQPLHLEYANAVAEFPDFHSGFKLFTRASAEDVFVQIPPRLEGVSDRCVYHHACEAVMVVEAILAGAYLGVVRRNTTNDQPISTFNLYSHGQLTADMIIWPCKRLGVPAVFVQQWLANHITRLLLATLAPDGKAVLDEVRRLVLASYSEDVSASRVTSLQPPFL